MPNNYIIITSANNEEAYIERTLKSIIKQTILPREWIIVDDGSIDKTAEIVKEYASKYSWIKLYSFAKEQVAFGEHIYHNFYRGFEKVTTDDFQVIVKLDADLDIDREDFFEFQLNKMEKNTNLGICSGITYSDHTGEKIFTKGRPYWRTGGAMKFYRRKCLEQIGGIKPIYGWDGLDEYQAMFYGWKTRTFFDLPVNHLGKERAIIREQEFNKAKSKGTSLYQRGYPFEFVLLKSITYIKMSFKHVLSFLLGYFDAKNNKIRQYTSKDEKKFIRRFQYKRIIDKFVKRELL